MVHDHTIAMTAPSPMPPPDDEELFAIKCRTSRCTERRAAVSFHLEACVPASVSLVFGLHRQIEKGLQIKSRIVLAAVMLLATTAGFAQNTNDPKWNARPKV